MSKFSIVGTGQDPFLSVHLESGESIVAESDAMVMMDSSLELTGTMRGGVLASMGRMFLNDESFFQQKIHAKKAGDVLLAPPLPGEIQVVTLDNGRRLMINDSAFLACDDGVEVKNVTQSLGRAFFGGTGGLFVMEATGLGCVAVSGFGHVLSYELQPGQEVLIDNHHVVAWDGHLKYDVSVSTAKRGFLSGLVNSVTSGEGVVNRFYATSKAGVVYVAARNRKTFAAWVRAQVPTQR
jgi:uncharacterized protein (TIGR00266 family)